jgi:kanamycin kinase
MAVPYAGSTAIQPSAPNCQPPEAPKRGNAEFIKVANADVADFAGEAERLRWAARYVTVPHVLGSGFDQDTTDTARGCAPARCPACRPYTHDGRRHRTLRCERSARVCAALQHRLEGRAGGSCPFEWSVANRLAKLPPSARTHLGPPPPIDQPVVCHGDACSPNTLIDDGHCRGHVDFGELGVADRWADLAVTTLSLGRNHPGRRWDAEFLAAHGVEPDPARIDYHRRLFQAEDAASR